MRWWQEILPVEQDLSQSAGTLRIHYQGASHNFTPEAAGPVSSDAVMLVRRRLSRIFYRRRFFDYPLSLNASTLKNLGVFEALHIGLSYGKAQFARRLPEISLEDFLINRFGSRLYRRFFKGYTEKVWGVPCGEISAEWGAQRIKGLSVSKALKHALGSPFRGSGDAAQSRAKADRDQPDRSISLSEIWTGPNVGGSRASCFRTRRKNTSAPSNTWS
jgi:hypothetical protein